MITGVAMESGRTLHLNMKTYDIEIQRLKSARHDKGVIEPAPTPSAGWATARDDGAMSSTLRLPVEHARTL